MNFKIKKQTGTIEVIIPHDKLSDGSIYQSGAYFLLIESLSQSNQYIVVDDNGIEYNVAKINSINPEFISNILNDSIINGLDGYEINMKNGLQIPYIYIDKSLLNMEFKDTEILLKDYCISYVIDIEDDTMAYVEIGHYNNGSRGLYTQFYEIKEWAIEYGIDNVKIIDKIINDIEI